MAVDGFVPFGYDPAVESPKSGSPTESPRAAEHEAGVGRSLSTLSQVPVAVVAQTAEHSEALAARVGESVREFLSYLGALSKLSGSSAKRSSNPHRGFGRSSTSVRPSARGQRRSRC